MAKTKETCPISRKQFKEIMLSDGGGELSASIDKKEIKIPPKEFSTGSIGWYGNMPVTVRVNGVLVHCRAQVSITINGSKELPPA